VWFGLVKGKLGLEELVDLRRQDEIALRQTIDLVGPGRDFDSSPSKEDVWVVSLLLGKRTDAIYKPEGPTKVGKLKGLRDVMSFDDVPPINLPFKYGELLTLERGHSSTAGNARLGGKVGHRRTHSTTRR
jgi:hypothetical protein